MTISLESIPGIKKAALEIAYNNDIINRTYSEEDYLKTLNDYILSLLIPENNIIEWSNWLDCLSEEKLHSLCCGEDEEINKILLKAPNKEGLDSLLDDIFEVGFCITDIDEVYDRNI